MNRLSESEEELKKIVRELEIRGCIDCFTSYVFLYLLIREVA